MLFDRLSRFLDPADSQALRDCDYRAIDARSGRFESMLCRALILDSVQGREPHAVAKPAIPNRIVQFWDQTTAPPDVEECMKSWKDAHEFAYARFDDEKARDFIRENFGSEHLVAYGYCHHPAMRCDYFRLCYLLREGGIYMDADDVYVGGVTDRDLGDSGLRLNFLCTAKDHRMIPRERVLAELAEQPEWRCYFNNDPLFSSADHPVLQIALDRSTSLITKAKGLGETCSIHWVTGPENLTFSLVEYVCRSLRDDRRPDFSVLLNWPRIGAQRWDLAYRSTDRDWRSNATI